MPNVIPPLPPDSNTLAILLDVDGTLLDLAPTPREVFVPHALRDTLGRLWERTGGAVAFVSGRPVSDLDLHLRAAAIAGDRRPRRRDAHGRRGAAGAPRLAPLDRRIETQDLPPSRRLGPGIMLEDKGYSLALHYRLAPDKERAVRESAAKSVVDLQTAPSSFLPGKLVVEVKQRVSKATRCAN